MSGLGKNLRELDINVPIESQKAVFGTAFDPVALDCAVVELSQSWCPPCRRLIPHLIALQNKYPNVKIMQISPEPVAKLQGMFAGQTPSYTVSSVTADIWEDFSRVLGVQGIPHTCIIDKGEIRFSGHPAEPEFEKVLAMMNSKYAPKTE